MKFNDYIAVQKDTEGVLGKILYYSVSNILIDRDEFQQIGRDFGLAKTKPARESASDAFSKATTALYDRVTVKCGNTAAAYRIYCRTNKRTAKDTVSRELVKEEVCESTNSYKKLMNIEFDKAGENIRFCNKEYDYDIELDKYCDETLRLYQLYRTCYNSTHVETVLESLLNTMQANKISIRGRIFFVPKQNLGLVSLFEDYVSAIAAKNNNVGDVICNSMFVVDDGKQRLKMKEEFYTNYKRDIEQYQERIRNFIANGGNSKAVIERWIKRIDDLKAKKSAYEDILKQELDDLNDDFEILNVQAQELIIRSGMYRQLSLAA
jgi:Arc/MetJ family transcription regulator